MPKRFTETLKWDDKWFRALKPEFKLAWLYILDKCDGAGVIDIDHALADFQIGMSVDWEGFFKATETRLEPLAKGKHWVCKFIEFQYGSVSEDCKPHKPVISSLKKHGLCERVLKGYPKGIERVKEKEQEQEEETEQAKAKEPRESVELYSPVVPEWMGPAWERWMRVRFTETGQWMDVIQQESNIMELSRRGQEKALKDLEFMIRTGAKNVLDSNNDFQKRQSVGTNGKVNKATKF